jgi:hypothetical protein
MIHDSFLACWLRGEDRRGEEPLSLIKRRRRRRREYNTSSCWCNGLPRSDEPDGALHAFVHLPILLGEGEVAVRTTKGRTLSRATKAPTKKASSRR